MHQSIQRLAQTCGLEVNRLEKEHLVTRMVYRIASPLVYTDEEALLPGSAVHEAGGARMGDDPQRFVLNRFNQCWDAKNVLVTDSAAFTTSPFQNPGLTIMAMTARACHHIANELRLEEV
jgi:choline dehydrogenase-like flavoprotein